MGPMRSLPVGSHDAGINEVIQAPRKGIMRPVCNMRHRIFEFAFEQIHLGVA